MYCIFCGGSVTRDHRGSYVDTTGGDGCDNPLGVHRPAIRREAIRYLTRDAETGEDTGHLRVPCSRYGRDSAECAPVAWRVAYLVSRETGEPVTQEGLDHAMSMVVNDHDDVAYMVRTYGRHDYGRSIT